MEQFLCFCKELIPTDVNFIKTKTNLYFKE